MMHGADPGLRVSLGLLGLLAALGCSSGPEAAPVEKPAPAVAVQARPAQPSLTPVTEVEGISEYRLENGLKVLLFPDPSVSTVTVNVTYRVGSRHEGLGEGGMAHLLEHMVFKGTPTFPDVKGALQDRGAQWNGSTSYDRTNYFETLPASEENLDLALRLEADRMVNSTIRAEDLATEMTVVRNEFERGENDPTNVLQQRMLSTAYLFHSYGRPTIGNRSDIERVPAESLRAFYRRYYQPDNAMLVVAGRFEPARALGKIQSSFGALPRPKRSLDEPYTIEPPQDGPRAVVLSRVGSIAAVGLVYHVPAGPHPDMAALRVLQQVLTDRPGGRLYKALVESKKAAEVGAFASRQHDPGVFTVYASVPLDQNAEEIQRRLIDEVEKVAGTIKPEEVERARNRLLKEVRINLTDSRRVALSLSEYEAIGDWRMLFMGRDQLAQVGVDDVNRVAREYLIASNRTAGLYRPTAEPRRAEIPAAPDLALLLKDYRGSAALAAGESFDATAENIEKSTQRRGAAGIKLALLPKKTRGEVVQGAIRLWYGTEKSLAGRNTAALIMPELMRRGTAHRDFQGIRDALDELEMQLTLSGSPGQLDVELRTTRTHLGAALKLVAEILREPSFPASELELIRRQLLTSYESERTDPNAQLREALARALAPYPPSSILYRPTLDERIERVRKLKRDSITELHRRFLGGQNMQASFVGDFDSAELEKKMAETFGNWTAAEPFERIPVPYVAYEPLEKTIDTPDKKMAIVGGGVSFRMRTDDPDYPAVSFANYVLGQSARSRLWASLREKAGISYSVGSVVDVSDDNEPARLVATAIAAPENARKAQTLLRQELQRWLEQPIAEGQLSEYRSGYLESFRNRLSDDNFLAGALLTDVRLGRPFTFRQQVVDTAVNLTPEQIQTAVRTHLGSTPVVNLIAGDVAKFAPAAEAVGADTEGE